MVAHHGRPSTPLVNDSSNSSLAITYIKWETTAFSFFTTLFLLSVSKTIALISGQVKIIPRHVYAVLLINAVVNWLKDHGVMSDTLNNLNWCARHTKQSTHFHFGVSYAMFHATYGTMGNAKECDTKPHRISKFSSNTWPTRNFFYFRLPKVCFPNLYF